MNELFFDNKIDLTFIEPFPVRLNALITTSDKKQTNIVESLVQDVDISLFKNLCKNDILFVDSSHVVKTGSDLHHILFNILPILNSGASYSASAVILIVAGSVCVEGVYL